MKVEGRLVSHSTSNACICTAHVSHDVWPIVLHVYLYFLVHGSGVLHELLCTTLKQWLLVLSWLLRSP